MSRTCFRLKQSTGWFAAGPEVARAVTLLSDAALKLFLWLCLQAERGRGTASASLEAIAHSLGKSETEIAETLNELVQKGVCARIADSLVEITDRFWPYERLRSQETLGTLSIYVGRVKGVFLQRGCVRSAFTAADEQLAVELFRKGVPIENVERGILLGSLRKYVALLNHRHGTPITTLHYFTGVFEEDNQLKISTQYWNYVAYKVQDPEQRWRNSILRDTTTDMETKKG